MRGSLAMTYRWRLLDVAGVLALVAVPGCGTDVVVAEVRVGQPCSTANPCLPGEYCYTKTCGATDGTCQLPPTACVDDSQTRVCGCGGVIYWNDCVRAMNRVAATEDCMVALPKTCASQADCTGGSVCGIIGACDATKTLPGTCWVLPPTCPSDTGPFATCDGAHACMNLCAAIATQESFQALAFDPSCQ